MTHSALTALVVWLFLCDAVAHQSPRIAQWSITALVHDICGEKGSIHRIYIYILAQKTKKMVLLQQEFTLTKKSFNWGRETIYNESTIKQFSFVHF